MAEERLDGRTRVVWETSYPVRALDVVAGRWEVRREGDVAVYFHPGHERNVDEMLATLVAARRHYSEWFHPYPWRELKLSEFPNLETNARGFPSHVHFSEGIGFLTRSQGSSSLVFLVTAHEAAHQWWGNLLAAADGPGTGHLVEGMAHYSALLLQEAVHGERGRIELARRMEESYLRLRRRDTEKPLIEMVDDRSAADWTVVYEKGAWVTWMLDRHLGRERTLAGLRSFIRRFRGADDHPATQDLIEALRPYAPDPEAYQAFVDQWFYDVVLPEVRLSEVAVTPAEGRWRVAATVGNVGTGTVTVEVAAERGERFPSTGDGSPRDGRSFAERRTAVRLAPGQRRRVALTTDFEPEKLVVDPDVAVLQSNRSWATVELTPR